MHMVANTYPTCGIPFGYDHIRQSPKFLHAGAAGAIAGDEIRMFLVDNECMRIFSAHPAKKIQIANGQHIAQLDRPVAGNLTKYEEYSASPRPDSQVVWWRAGHIVLCYAQTYDPLPENLGAGKELRIYPSRSYETFKVARTSRIEINSGAVEAQRPRKQKV